MCAMSREMLNDVKLKMKPVVALEKLNLQCFYVKSEEKQENHCSGGTVIEIAEQNNSSSSGRSSGSHLTHRNHVEVDALQNRTSSCTEKSLNRTPKLQEKPHISGVETGHTDLFVVGETLRRNDSHQEEKMYGMDFQKSQQQNDRLSKVVATSVSSMEPECCVVEDENGRSPVMETESQSCSDKPMTEQQKFYKEFMDELVKLRQDLEAERTMRRQLENKVSHQSKKIEELKLKTLPVEETVKNPPIRLRLEAVTTGNYISTLDHSESSHARSPNDSHGLVEEIKREICDDSPTEDTALNTDDLHLHSSTLDDVADVIEIQGIQVSGRQSSKNLKKHNFRSFCDSVSCAENAARNCSKIVKSSQWQLKTNSESSLKKPKTNSDIVVFSSNCLVTSKDGVNRSKYGVKLQPHTVFSACTRDVEVVDTTVSVLKGTKCNSVNEGLSPDDTGVDIAGKRLFSEPTSGSRVTGSTIENASLMDQSCSDDRNCNHVTRNDTSDTNVARNDDGHCQISKGKTDKNLRKVMKDDGNFLPLSNIGVFSEKRAQHDSGSHQHDEHELQKWRKGNEHFKKQFNVGLVDEDCNQSKFCSGNKSFEEIESGNERKSKSNDDLMHQSCPAPVNDNYSLFETHSISHDKQMQISEIQTRNMKRTDPKQKHTEIIKYNSGPQSTNFTKENGVLCSKGRTRNMSTECKTKNSCKSSLDYVYGCNFCGLKFCDMESLQCHMPCVGSVASKDPLKCSACSKTFRESADLLKHLRGITTNKIFKCEICGKICASRSCLVWHMQIHADVEPENCENQSNAVSRDLMVNHKSSECMICHEQFLSKLCLQSHMKEHTENERELHSRAIVDCQADNSVILEQLSNPREPTNRSFQDALDFRLFTSDLASKPSDFQEQTSRRHCDRERNSWNIFDHDRLFSDSGSSLPLNPKENKSREPNWSSHIIFDRDVSAKMATGQNESTPLIRALESGVEIKKTYRPYCVKCWASFEDLQALEEHAKFCNGSCLEPSPRELIPICLNECIIPKSEDQPQSSAFVMENGLREVTLNSVEDVTEVSVHVSENNSSEVLKIGSDKMVATSNLNGSLDDKVIACLAEVVSGNSLDWTKKNSSGLARKEPGALSNMIDVLAKNAADDLPDSESDDMADSFSEDLANIQSYLDKGDSDFLVTNGSGDLPNVDSGDPAENGLGDLAQNGISLVTKSVLGNVTNNWSKKVFRSGSREFLRSDLVESTKRLSDGVAKNGSNNMTLIESNSQKLTETVLNKGVKCGSDEELYCVHCCKIFSSQQQLKKHLELHKKFGSSLCCSQCKHKFTLLDSLQEHTCNAYSVIGQQFRCPECDQGFEIGLEFKKHMRNIHSVEQHFECKHCGKQYDSFWNWNSHVQGLRTDRHYVCNKCGRKFKHLHHLKSGHLPCLSDSVELKCPKCNLGFENASRLRGHMAYCQNERALKCQFCHRIFNRKSVLDKHMVSHTGEKPYQCSQCEKRFGFRKDLIRHIYNLHTTEKPYVCDVCNKVFEDLSFLLSHLRTHLSARKKSSSGAVIYQKSNEVQKKMGEKHVPKLLFGCGLCGRVFLAMMSLKRHLPCQKVTVGNDPFYCGDCDKRFCDENELGKHVSSAHSENFFSCSICKKLFATKLSLKLHMYSHSDVRPYKCKQCNKGFKHKHHFQSHLPCYVSPGSDIRCKQCQMTFSRLSQLRTHISIEHSKGAVQCNVCGKKFARRFILNLHVKKHVRNSKKPFSCTHCAKCFLHSSSLKRHLEAVFLDSLKHDDKNKKIDSKYDANLKPQISPITAGTGDAFHCRTCNRTFSTQQKLNKHMELHKRFGSSLHCSDCNQKFTLLESLKEHTCQPYSIMGPQFRCPECESGFEISRELKKHMSDVHSINQSFKCKQCGKHYEKFCLWNAHVQAHRTDRRYVCKKCGKSYKYIHHLKTDHLPCLSDFVELKCPKCNLEFVKKSHLRRHMTLCQNDQAAQCQVCNRFFISQLRLERHMCCLTGEKPYQCSQCDKRFSSRQGLHSHIDCHHTTEKSYVCDVCGEAFSGKIFFQSHLRKHSTDRDNFSFGGKIKRKSNHLQKKKREKQTPKRLYGCGLCGFRYLAIITLKRHLPCDDAATGVKNPFFCGECNEKFCEENELEEHVKCVHSEILFGCSVCGRMFAKKKSLKLHMHSHSEKPFKCTQCSKVFKYRQHLNWHSPCYDSPQSDIQCNKCHMTFYKASQLKTHLKIDHSNTAVQCDVCGKKFENCSVLERHFKRHAEEIKKTYSCTHCTKSFVHISSLRRHLETFHLEQLKSIFGSKNFSSKDEYDKFLEDQISPITAGTNVLQCLNCGKTFSSQQKLNKHLELHKKFGSSLSCSQCRQKFTLLESLEKHTCNAYSFVGVKFRCPECEEGFEISRQLKKHMRDVHSVEQHFKCKHCGKQYDKFCIWNSHVQGHRTDRYYVCNKCGSKFKHLHHLKTGHFPCISESEELKCPTCDKKFVKAAQLRNHVKLCQNERAVKCHVCHGLFRSKLKLDRHMVSHTGEKPYHCSECNKCFSSRPSLITHLHRHSTEKPHICDVCGKAFAIKPFLQTHLRIHMTNQPYKCNQCNMSFLYACLLRVHNDRVHKGAKKRFACSICNKTFCSKMYLNAHMCSHTGQNPYLCSFCGKGFAGKMLLKYHQRVHTGEKPYACQFCFRRFSMPRSMRNHERVHTGEKPYECTICGMKFPQSSYLKSHSRKVHKI